jgi:hypothetical protein
VRCSLEIKDPSQTECREVFLPLNRRWMSFPPRARPVTRYIRTRSVGIHTMQGLFGISDEMNEETESFFAWPSSQGFIAQSLGEVFDGGEKCAIGCSNVGEVGSTGSGGEVLDGVDVVQRGSPVVGACVFDAICPRSDCREVEGRRPDDLGEALARLW